MDYQLRIATSEDCDAIRRLIDLSSRAIGLQDYSPEQIEGALEAAWGLDNQLVADSTYFAVEKGAVLVGCGGWSFRATLFGGGF